MKHRKHIVFKTENLKELVEPQSFIDATSELHIAIISPSRRGVYPSKIEILNALLEKYVH